MKADVNLGQAPGNGARRDAIHVAVLPAVACEDLEPGDHVGVVMTPYGMGKEGRHIGIVDPFRKKGVKSGERFWLLLYPQTISYMRHVWEHPEIVNEGDELKLEHLKEKYLGASERWLRDFAQEWDIDFDRMVAAARDGGEIVAGTSMTRADVVEYDLFWEHMEKYLGERIPASVRSRVIWTCAC